MIPLRSRSPLNEGDDIPIRPVKFPELRLAPLGVGGVDGVQKDAGHTHQLQNLGQVEGEHVA